MIKPIDIKALRKAINLRDLTDPQDGEHALQIMMEAILVELKNKWQCEIKTCRKSPIVSVAENYDDLHYLPEGKSRDIRYTRYVCKNALLRTQTTSTVTGEMKAMSQNMPDHVLLACPGLVYRRDSIDRLHCAEPHHMDLWRLKKSGKAMTVEDLEDMVALVVNTALPDTPWRVVPSPHPYTEHGIQIDALYDDEWVEIGECGIAGSKILRENLPDYPDASGLAMGLGLDRLLMVRKKIPDIRLLHSEDPRVQSQMLDLEPYQPVSCMPPVTRDISIAVDEGDMDEDIGDIVREALGDNAEVVEMIEILSETPYNKLPPQAIERLGIQKGQKNVLVRIVLRSLERTLTHDECNAYRNAIYKAVHKGNVWHWA